MEWISRLLGATVGVNPTYVAAAWDGSEFGEGSAFDARTKTRVPVEIEDEEPQLPSVVVTRQAVSLRQRIAMRMAASPAGKAVRVVARLLYGTGRERVITNEHEQAAGLAYEAFAVGADNEDGVVIATLVQRRQYVGRVAREVKATNGFGTPKYTEANVLVVQRKVADVMEKHGVRKSHIARLMPLAVILVFTPLPEEIEAQQMWASARLATAREDNATWARIEGGVFEWAPCPARA